MFLSPLIELVPMMPETALLHTVVGIGVLGMAVSFVGTTAEREVRCGHTLTTVLHTAAREHGSPFKCSSYRYCGFDDCYLRLCSY
jgi:hypothetical protein